MIKNKNILEKVTDSDLALLKNNPEEFWKDVEIIGPTAFAFTNIEELNIPDNVREIQIGAFYNCSKLKILKLPKNLEILEKNTIYKCPIENLEIPKNVNLESRAIESCNCLKYIKFEKGFKNLKPIVCLNCENLKTIDLPDSIENIDKSAFHLCNVTSVVLSGKMNTQIKNFIIKNNIKDIIVSSVKDIDKNFKDIEFDNIQKIKNNKLTNVNHGYHIIKNLIKSAVVSQKEKNRKEINNEK